MSYQWIRASEINDYVYCQRAWWLKRTQGVTAQNVHELARGDQFHQAHGQTVWRAIWVRRLAYALLFLLVTFLTYQILMSS